MTRTIAARAERPLAQPAQTQEITPAPGPGDAERRGLPALAERHDIRHSSTYHRLALNSAANQTVTALIELNQTLRLKHKAHH
jgi:hypothetical protein